MKLGNKNKENLKIISALLSTPSNKSIVLAKCDELELRAELFDLLDKELKKHRISIYQLDIKNQSDGKPINLVKIISRIIRTKDFAVILQRQKNIVFFAYGIEKFNQTQEKEFISYLNFMRDEFAKISYPIVIWLNTPMVEKIAQNAPDFWSWRSAFYEFEMPKVKISLPKEIPHKKKIKREYTGTLADLFNNLNPSLLGSTEEWKFYVSRPPDDPMSRLKFQLLSSTKFDKILFTGLRGTGKSTELNRLSIDLQEEFFVVYYSIQSFLDVFDLEYTDLLFSMAALLYQQAVEQDIELKKRLSEDIILWLKKMISTTSVQVDEKDLTPRKITSFFSAFLSEIRFSHLLRMEVRKHLQLNLSTLIKNINQIIMEIEMSTSKSVLMIIDDLDKINLKVAENLFAENGTILTQPQCKIIYNTPAVFYYHPNTRLIDITFDNIYYLHNIKIQTINGEKSVEGLSFLKEVILKRIPQNLINPDALDKAVYMSGGNLRELLRLIQRACLEALTVEKQKISIEEVNKSIREIYNDYIRTLSKEDYKLLSRIYKEKKMDDESKRERFLHLINGLSVIEYENDTLWYDVHPIVKELLNDKLPD